MGTVHQVAKSFTHPTRHVVCTCGAVIEGADAAELDRLFVDHRREALAGDHSGGLARARAALADALDRKETAR